MSSAVSQDFDQLLIRRVDAIPLSLPLLKPMLMGGGQVFDRSECLLVRIESTTGLVGWGEASAAPTMTGDTLPGMLEITKRYLRPALIGANVLDFQGLSQRLQRVVVGNTGAKAACEIAIHDLAGHHLGVSVSKLLGGAVRDSVRVMHLLGNLLPEDDLTEALEKQKEGYHFIKLKVGVKDVESEINIALKLREVLGDDFWLCADANTGMSLPQAIIYVNGVSKIGLKFLEQPLQEDDIVGAVELAKIGKVPLCADEALHGIPQIRQWNDAGAIQGVNLKTIKLGGIQPTMQAAILSHELGLKIDLAAKLGESSIGSAALIHLAYTVPNLDWGVNPVSQYLAEDIVRKPLVPILGSIPLPSGPGLGVDVDEDLVRKFTV